MNFCLGFSRFCVFFWAFTSLAISTTSFGYYYSAEGGFQNVNVFSIIYLFNILIGPLNALPWTISGMLVGNISYNRIDSYL